MLSSGFRNLLGMVFDIAYRMAVLNPDLLENVVEMTPGIVLIDEIDLHLHPRWQWKRLLLCRWMRYWGTKNEFVKTKITCRCIQQARIYGAKRLRIWKDYQWI